MGNVFRSWRSLTLAALFAAGVGAAPAHGQSVSAELLSHHPNSPGTSGIIQGGVEWRTGNIEFTDVRLGTQITTQRLHADANGHVRTRHDHAKDDHAFDPHAPLPWVKERILVRGDGQFAQNEGHVFLALAWAHVRWTRWWHRRVGTEVYAQYQFDQFLALRTRILGGIGLRIEAIHEHRLMMTFGTSYMPEYEDVNLQPGDTHPGRIVNHRWSNFWTVRWAPVKDNWVLKNTVFLQPRIDRFTDIRILENLEFEVEVTKTLSVGSAFLVRWDSDPPAGVDPVDTGLHSHLKIRF